MKASINKKETLDILSIMARICVIVFVAMNYFRHWEQTPWLRVKIGIVLLLLAQICICLFFLTIRLLDQTRKWPDNFFVESYREIVFGPNRATASWTNRMKNFFWFCLFLFNPAVIPVIFLTELQYKAIIKPERLETPQGKAPTK
jgi:hypothetical protein